MTFLHPAILYGLGLALLPVILHLLLKQKPKKLLFPALRLIANRKKQNVRRMRLRHFWLLLLRILLIGLLVFAVARPSVPAADYSLNVREWLSIVVLIGLAIGVFFLLSRRWKAAAVPRHERRFRESKLRSGLIAGTLALLLLTVAWPYQRRIAAKLKAPSPAGDVSLPVAAVFLFDTSLSMQYQQEGKTRLDVARQVAITHLSDLAAGSRIAVADVASDNPILFQTTMAGAKTRMESLEIRPRSLPINDRIRAALRLHDDDRARTLAEQSSVADEERKDRYLRRIYALTDVTKSAFQIGGRSRLAAELEAQPNVNLFLVDVSEDAPQNIALTMVEPSHVRLSEQETFTVRTTIGRTGSQTAPSELLDNERASDSGTGGQGSPSYAVELLLQDQRGKPIKVAQQSIELSDETPQVMTFGPLKPEFGPVVHGEVRLVSSDPLSFDDVRRFTLEVRPAASILVVAPPPVADDDDAEEWSVALEVMGYRVIIRRPQHVSESNLSEYQAVCLINVPSLTDNAWYRLGQYVQQGGGLAVFLGDTQLRPANYGRDEAQVFLPARLYAHTAPGTSFLRFPNEQHPMFRALAEDDGIALLEVTDVEKFWRVIPQDEASVMATYAEPRDPPAELAKYGDAPALVERVHGKGRTIMMTTAVDVKPFPNIWNYLPSPQGPAWTFVVFADEMMRYLSHESTRRLTYDVGETPVLRFTAEDDDRSYLLQEPGFRQSRVDLPDGETVLSFPEATELGHYDLKAQGDTPGVVAGFSLNADPEESDFTRITTSELDELFGEDRYQIARSIGELKESINIADLGRELFPIILAALVLFFVGEHFVANWFYDEEGTTDARASWTDTRAKTPSTPIPAGASTS